MRRYPVVIMRWFRDGNAWAYDEGVSGEQLTEILDRVSPLVAEPGRFSFAAPLTGNRWIVGTREPDENCPDERARTRKPFVLRGAILPERPGDVVARDLAGRLAKVDLPTEPGARRGGMDVAPGTRPVVRPKVRRSIRSYADQAPSRVALAACLIALGLAGLGVLLPHFVAISTFWTRVLHATPFVVSLAILWFCRARPIPIAAIERCEERWDDCLLEPARERCVGPPVAEGVLASTSTASDSPQAVGSVRDGKTTTPDKPPAASTGLPSESERPFFKKSTLTMGDGRTREIRTAADVVHAYEAEVPLVVERTYLDCTITPDTAIVRGVETVEDAEGKSRPVSFVRQYRRQGIEVTLGFAQLAAPREVL